MPCCSVRLSKTVLAGLAPKTITRNRTAGLLYETEDELIQMQWWAHHHPGKLPEELGYHIEDIADDNGQTTKCAVKSSAPEIMKRKTNDLNTSLCKRPSTTEA